MYSNVCPLWLYLKYPLQRLTILADCSASMYRFNGTDGRLNRQLEALLMVMEGLDSKIAKEKIKWDIVGHSGDSRYIPLSVADNPPSNDKERLKVLQEAASYPQFCFPGDFTIEGMRSSNTWNSGGPISTKYKAIKKILEIN